MKRYVPYVAVAVGLLVVVYALFFGSSDEDEIRERLALLEETVEVRATQENIVLRAARIKDAFSEVFVKEVSIEIPELTNVRTGRAELVGLATQAPNWYRTANADLGGLRVDVDDAGLSALVSGPVTLQGTRLTGEPLRDERTVSIRCDKIDGEWRIVSLSVSAADAGDG
jgi:hypothetical protein